MKSYFAIRKVSQNVIKFLKHAKRSTQFCNALLLYLLVTAPIFLLVASSEYLQFQILQRATYLISKTTGVKSVYIGDSITAGGRNFFSPFQTINYGANGLLVSQIKGRIPRQGEKYQQLYILAGTNDAFRNDFDASKFKNDYKSLLEKSMQSNSDLIITLIPYTKNAKVNAKIKVQNRIIQDFSSDFDICVVDINKIIAPQGFLLDEYSVDRVHLSKAAYKVWRDARKSACP